MAHVEVASLNMINLLLEISEKLKDCLEGMIIDFERDLSATKYTTKNAKGLKELERSILIAQFVCEKSESLSNVSPSVRFLDAPKELFMTSSI